MKLFKSLKEWRKYALSAIRSVCVGMLRILWSVLFGLVSLLAYAYRSTCQFCKREFKAAFFAGLITVLLSVCWFGTFINDLGKVLMAYVGYDNDVAAFCLYHPDGRHGGTLCKNDDEAAIKVVGNIYDNPELIHDKKL